MGNMVYSLLWVMQDLYHQPYGFWSLGVRAYIQALGLPATATRFDRRLGTSK